MFYWVFILMLFISFPVLARDVVVLQATVPVERTLIRKIAMQGFQLEDKNQFVKIFKPYRNKYLTKADMDEILQKIQEIYQEEGFLELVSITYMVKKHRLIFTVSLTS